MMDFAVKGMALFCCAALAGISMASAETPAEMTPPLLTEEENTSVLSPAPLVYETLLQAVSAGKVYAALEMIKGGKKDDVLNEEGKNALLVASESGQPQVISVLADSGADLLARDALGNTALHLAARANDVYTTSMLVERGIPLIDINEREYTPLHEAAEAGSLESAKVLVQLGADPLYSPAGGTYFPAYVAAGKAKQWEITALFRNMGHNTNPYINAGLGDMGALREYAENDPSQLEKISRTNNTPLLAAVGNNQLEAVKFLLDHNVLIAPVLGGDLPQFAALRNGYKDILLAFFEHGITPNDRNAGYYGNTMLIEAVREGNLDMMQFLLDQGADMGYTSVRGETPLHAAVDAEQPEAALFLLDRGYIIDIKNAKAYSALHLAVEQNKPAMVELLLDHGANIELTEKRRWTPLHIAVDAHHNGMVDLLLKRGAQVNPRDKKGDLPFHIAAEKDFEDLGALLLAAGADCRAANQKGITPLHLTAVNGNITFTKRVLEAGADVNAADETSRTPLFHALLMDHYPAARVLAEHGASLEPVDGNGQTLMFAAAHSETADAVTWLADSGLAVNSTDQDGYTPLHIAARYGSEAPLNFLIEKGALIDAQNNNGEAPLHLASSRGHIINVRELVDKGADLFIKDKEGRYALHTGARNGHWGPLQLFLLRGVNVNVTDKYGDMALHLAARGGFQRTAKLLLARGADFTARNHAGETPLAAAQHALAATDGAVGLTPSQASTRVGLRNTMIFLQAVIIDEYRGAAERNDIVFMKKLLEIYPQYRDAQFFGCAPLYRATRNKHAAIVRALLENKADPNTVASTDNGMTPLHQAVKSGREDLVFALLDAGARADLPDVLGVTPLELARQENLHNIVALLEKTAVPEGPSS